MPIKALAFDVIGTIFDYRGAILKEGAELSRRTGLNVDWSRLVFDWRARERLEQERIERGEVGWSSRDQMHRRHLDELLPAELTGADKDHLCGVWERLDAWPDVLEGMTRLRAKYLLVALSNSTISSLVRLARHAGLHWDLILSAELFKVYKPNRRVYEEAARLLNLRPAEMMMAAAHGYDLRAARSIGMKAAFIPRLEFGPDGPNESEADPDFEMTATDFVDLARQLGC